MEWILSLYIQARQNDEMKRMIFKSHVVAFDEENQKYNDRRNCSRQDR